MTAPCMHRFRFLSCLQKPAWPGHDEVSNRGINTAASARYRPRPASGNTNLFAIYMGASHTPHALRHTDSSGGPLSPTKVETCRKMSCNVHAGETHDLYTFGKLLASPFRASSALLKPVLECRPLQWQLCCGRS